MQQVVGFKRAIVTGAMALVLIWVGLVVPSFAEPRCCSTSIQICRCADSGETQCSPSICSPATEIFCHPSIGVGTFVLAISSAPVYHSPFKIVAVRAPKKLEATHNDYDKPPPPIFVNENLCFLPPPLLG